MSRLTLFVMFVLIPIMILFPQEETLFHGDIDHGGYGGPTIKYTQIGPDQSHAILMGGQGGWIIDHTFIIGGGGYGLVNNVEADWLDMRTFVQSEPLYLYMGYGGLLLGFTRWSDDLIHYTIHTMIGGGGIDYRLADEFEEDSTSDGIFVIEPGACVEFNISSFFRIAVGATYRYVQGVDLTMLDNSDLSAFTGHLEFKFGSF